MTTIAYKDGVMAGDTLVTQDGIKIGYTSKICKIEHKNEAYLLGVAGEIGDINACREYVVKRVRDGAWGEEPICLQDKNVDAILAHRSFNGNIQQYWVNPNGTLSVANSRHMAAGGGFKIAAAVMEMGGDAEQAVMIASSLDTRTGGPTEVLRLVEPVAVTPDETNATNDVVTLDSDSDSGGELPHDDEGLLHDED